MPFTSKQRRFFHAAAARGEKGMQRMADEADDYARAGKEKPPVKKRKRSKGEKARVKFLAGSISR